MAQKIEYIAYKFRKPFPLTEYQYNVFKYNLMMNPKYKIAPKNNFYEDFKVYIIYISICILLILIGLIPLYSWLEWLSLIGTVLWYFHFLVLYHLCFLILVSLKISKHIILI